VSKKDIHMRIVWNYMGSINAMHILKTKQHEIIVILSHTLSLCVSSCSLPFGCQRISLNDYKVWMMIISNIYGEYGIPTKYVFATLSY
jgi:hypothetical protein